MSSLSRAVDWLAGGGAPALGAVAAAALLVIFVASERDPAALGDVAPQIAPEPAASISIVSPSPNAERRGDLTFTWQAVPGAVRYRVVIVDLKDGGVLEAGRTEDTSLLVAEPMLRERFGETEPRAIHWIVRARLIDGTEVSSEPFRLTWLAS